jgi:hypothetical protein
MTHLEFLKSLLNCGWQISTESTNYFGVTKDTMILTWNANFPEILVLIVFSPDFKRKHQFIIHNQKDIRI